MEVVDVVLGDEGVQRRVDRRHGAAVTEPAVLVVADDVVLVDPGGMNGLEGPDPIEIEEGQPGCGHRPEIAARALDRQDPCRGTPVIGSARVTLADVLPPAKLVTRLSAPRRLDRASEATIVASSPTPASWSATFDSL